MFKDKYGPWAFIAGASMGIGRALSLEAAARGLNVVMNARGAETLAATAAEVRATHGVEVRELAADLTDPMIGEIVAGATDDLEIGLFVYNATVAPIGLFLTHSLELQLQSVQANCATPLILLNQFAPKMVARGRGGISLVSSTGGTQGAVTSATYNAGKAFEWILAESLWSELGDQGVDVTAMLVGATASPNFNAFKDTLDPELCNKANSEDLLDRMRNGLVNPTEPETVATSLYDGLPNGPVTWSKPLDEWITTRSLAMPRDEVTLTWRALMETSTRPPERQAR
ncbi:SDR family NAD(P)-dependent oxidoreductase [Pseudofrankia sp. BMG5.36]|uniref:SDR family NAD(P)-dependent oxidoreductase n=1 Tax=Pseudofrankia sp. BMG5.36 TaxID=1834512 RepID=UPI0008D9C20C|nr:SDR family NAD(P)-dependent oxidoreductase [Pseudofrankia sp. BMG5.36]OHV68218.1 short-chain dehydrogenase [Pseudofrankia sp. BMG5.36]